MIHQIVAGLSMSIDPRETNVTSSPVDGQGRMVEETSQPFGIAGGFRETVAHGVVEMDDGRGDEVG